LIEINFDKPEYVAELYNTLASYQEKVDDKEGLIASLVKVRNIYQELYGTNDKRVIVIKRQISIKLLQAENHQLALEELLDTEVNFFSIHILFKFYFTKGMEMKYYGENSVHVAKTQKIIGTIYILMQKHAEAQKYLMKALKIFEENGVKKAVAEIKSKLKLAKDIKDKGKNEIRKASDDEEN